MKGSYSFHTVMIEWRAARLHFRDVLEKTSLWGQESDQWLLRVVGEGQSHSGTGVLLPLGLGVCLHAQGTPLRKVLYPNVTSGNWLYRKVSKVLTACRLGVRGRRDTRHAHCCLLDRRKL